ncbi:hypothetical protein CDAR_577601 [Caerostris darwini]|uniref:Uncharacterized protein n=1 Tax=Caerostris darwini TaxID=1538125 RepID=A0AAV4URM3_9ARAC|nr:hypothetical protein CDAR_577601 [Caerostris darwini]
MWIEVDVSKNPTLRVKMVAPRMANKCKYSIANSTQRGTATFHQRFSSSISKPFIYIAPGVSINPHRLSYAYNFLSMPCISRKSFSLGLAWSLAL